MLVALHGVLLKKAPERLPHVAAQYVDCMYETKNVCGQPQEADSCIIQCMYVAGDHAGL